MIKMLRSVKVEYFTLFLFIIIIYGILTYFSSPILLWDENVYLLNAKKILEISEYSEEFRFPLLSWLLVPLIFFFGENIFLIKIFFLIIFSISIVFFYSLLEKYYKDSWKNIMIVIFLLLNGLLLFWANRIYPDVLGISFLIFSIYYLYKFQEENKIKYLILLSLFSVLSFLTKFYFGVFASIIFSYYLIKDKKVALKYTIFSLLFLSPWLIYNYLFYGNPLWNLLEQFRLAYLWQYHEPLSKFINNLLNYFGFLLLPLIIFSINFKKLNDYEKILFIYTIIMLIYFSFFVKMKDPRYLISIIPTIFVFARKSLEIPSFILILSFLYGISTSISFYNGIKNIIEYNRCWDGTDVISFTIHYLKKNNATSVISNCCWVWIANYLNIKAYSLWTDIDYLVELHKPDYIVCGNFGLKYDCDGIKYRKEIEYIDFCGNWVKIYKV